eukprot:4951351-Amphidinium_carterae.1
MPSLYLARAALPSRLETFNIPAHTAPLSKPEKLYVFMNRLIACALVAWLTDVLRNCCYKLRLGAEHASGAVAEAREACNHQQ